MLSDVSDLTEFSEDDGGEYVPTSGGKKSQKKTRKNAASSKQDRNFEKQHQLIMKNSLRPPRTATYSAQALYDQIHNGSIDLNPEYQRDVVWPETKQSGLIDSMLKNYYIPPVIFAVTVNEDGAEIKTCIDGKQRLTSLQKFMDGQIPHKDSHTGLKFWYSLSKGNSNGRLLPQNYRQQFTNKQVMCVEYDGLMEDAEREIFQRVQLGMALTPAERMHAITGPWAALIRDVINKYFPSSSSAIRDSSSFMTKHKTEDLALLIEWSATRGRDFQLIASVIYFLEKEPASLASIPTHPSAPTVVKWLTRNTNPSEELIKKVHDVFTIFILFARDNTLIKIFSKPQRISPAEFIMAGVLISRKMEECTLEMLANAIAKMKADVRSSHQDIRANARINKHMFKFIYEHFPKKSELIGRGKTANRDNRTAASIVRNIQIGVPPSSSSGAAGKANGSVQREKKRRRKADTSDSSDEDNGESEMNDSDSGTESDSESQPEPEPMSIVRRGRPAKNATALQTAKRTITSSLSARSTNLKRDPAPSTADLTPPLAPPFPTALDMSSLSLKNSSQVTGRELETDRSRVLSRVVGPGSSAWLPIDLSQQSDIVDENMPLTRANEVSGRPFKHDVVIKQENQEPDLSTFNLMTPTSSVSTGSTSNRLAGLRAAKARISLGSMNAADTSFAQQPSISTPVSASSTQMVNLANTDATTLLQMISDGTLQAQLHQIAQFQPVVQPQRPPVFQFQNPSISTQSQTQVSNMTMPYISPELQSVINELIKQQQQQRTSTGTYLTPPPAGGSMTQGSGIPPVTPLNFAMPANDHSSVPMTPQSLSSSMSQSKSYPDTNFAAQSTQADQSPVSRSSSRSASAVLDLKSFSAGNNDMDIESLHQNLSDLQESQERPPSSEPPAGKTVHWTPSHSDNRDRSQPWSFRPRPRPERRGYGKNEDYDGRDTDRFRGTRYRGSNRSRSPSFRGGSSYRNNRLDEDDVRFVRKATSASLLDRVGEKDTNVIDSSDKDEERLSESRD